MMGSCDKLSHMKRNPLFVMNLLGAIVDQELRLGSASVSFEAARDAAVAFLENRRNS